MKPLTQFEKMRNNRAMLEWHLQQKAMREEKAAFDKARADMWGDYLNSYTQRFGDGIVLPEDIPSPNM